ncbi:nuclease-related domain-containing protein [Geodermatophilus sp. SYSU D01180]
MYVIEANEPNRTEQEIVPALADQSGVLVLCPMVVYGDRTRELDAIVITPHRVTVVEGKGTRMRGQLTPALNGPWMVGGERADFAGRKNPYLQARQAMQVLVGAAEDAGVARMPFVHFVVAVAGAGVQTDTPALQLGDGQVCTMRNLAQVTGRPDQRQQDVTVETVTALLALLDLHVDEATLRAQGFLSAGEAVQRRMAARRPSPGSPVVVRSSPTSVPSWQVPRPATPTPSGRPGRGAAGRVATLAVYLGVAAIVEALLYWAYLSLDAGLLGSLIRLPVSIAMPVVALFAVIRVGVLLLGRPRPGRYGVAGRR